MFGASVATTTGRSIGVLFQLWQLYSGKHRVVVRPRHVRVNLPVLWRLLRVSITGILQFLVVTCSYLGLVRIVSVFGSTAIAGYTIAFRMIIFTILPAWGLSNAAATLVGQNLGARKPQRAEQAVYRTGFYTMVYMLLVSGAFFFFLRRWCQSSRPNRGLPVLP